MKEPRLSRGSFSFRQQPVFDGIGRIWNVFDALHLTPNLTQGAPTPSPNASILPMLAQIATPLLRAAARGVRTRWLIARPTMVSETTGMSWRVLSELHVPLNCEERQPESLSVRTRSTVTPIAANQATARRKVDKDAPDSSVRISAYEPRDASSIATRTNSQPCFGPPCERLRVIP